MMRRLNFTGRRRIPRAKVTVRLVPAAGGVWAFDADYDLGEFDFPPASRVYVEAYNATSYMRFAFGTVAKRETPADLRLAEITRSPLPKFRLKVVDDRHGLLLAVADKLLPLRPEEDETRKQPLLPVELTDLGERVWRLELTDWPVLELNRRIADVGEAARSADSFLALVYPEDQADPDFDASDWTSLWLRYACALPGVEAPPQGVGEEAAARKTQWIDQAVEAFCRARDARVRFERALGRGAL